MRMVKMMTESEATISLKGTETKRVPHLNLCVFGGTNVGKTYFALSYVRSQKKRMIFINADVEENFIRNFNLLNDEQRKRVIQPHRDDISGLQIGDVPSIKRIVSEIEKGAIQAMIKARQIELIAVDGLDAIISTYERWYFDNYVSGAPTPFDYGRARDIFEREFLLPLLRQPCHFLATCNYEVVYPQGATQFSKPLKVTVAGRQIIAHQPKLPGRFWKHFTTIVEMRQVNPFQTRDVEAFFIKSKEHYGLFGYQRLPKKNKAGLVYEDYLNYVREHFK